MINPVSKMKLYIVNSDDTLESIANKLNIGIEDIYRYNPIIRNHHLIPGMPLNLPVEENENETRNQNYTNCIQECSKIPFLIRLTIDSKIYIPERFNYLKQILEDEFQRYVFSLNTKDQDNLIYLFNTLCLQNYKIIDLLKVSNAEEIKKVVENKKKKAKEYLNLSCEKTYQKILDLIISSDNLWLLYIYKTASNQFDESEKIFANIQKKW